MELGTCSFCERKEVHLQYILFKNFCWCKYCYDIFFDGVSSHDKKIDKIDKILLNTAPIIVKQKIKAALRVG